MPDKRSSGVFPAISSRRRYVTRQSALYVAVLVLVIWYVFSGPGIFVHSDKKPATLWEDWAKAEEIYAFGDSWTTTGFDVNGTQPNRHNPLGNPEFPNDPKKAPPDWIAYLTGSYNASFVKTYNFAKGAATIDRKLVEPLFPMTYSFHEQVYDLFMPKYADDPGDPHVHFASSNQLFLVLFGLVDISLLSRDPDHLNTTIIEGICATYEDALSRLYATNARNFLLLTVPPLDLAPTPEDSAVLLRLISAFNARLRVIQTNLRAAHPDIRVRIFDLNALLRRLIKEPAAMPQTKMIRNTTVNCWPYNPDMNEGTQSWTHFDPECGIPRDQYFWANSLHLTHPVQEAMAARLVEDCFDAAGSSFASDKRWRRRRRKANGDEMRKGWGLCT